MQLSRSFLFACSTFRFPVRVPCHIQATEWPEGGRALRDKTGGSRNFLRLRVHVERYRSLASLQPRASRTRWPAKISLAFGNKKFPSIGMQCRPECLANNFAPERELLQAFGPFHDSQSQSRLSIANASRNFHWFEWKTRQSCFYFRRASPWIGKLSQLAASRKIARKPL